jgi:hypothetical protein
MESPTAMVGIERWRLLTLWHIDLCEWLTTFKAGKLGRRQEVNDLVGVIAIVETVGKHQYEDRSPYL